MSLQQQVVTSHPVMLQFGVLACFLFGAAVAAPANRRAPITNRACMFNSFLRMCEQDYSGAVRILTAPYPRWKCWQRMCLATPPKRSTNSPLAKVPLLRFKRENNGA